MTPARLRATAKTFWRGTHRAISPEATLARVAGPAKALGVTRVANVTGLDYLGVPVFMAVRPNARSLSVSQGKGLDAASAAASAVMEALELAHAEEPSLRRVRACYADLGKRAIDPVRLPRIRGAPPAPDQTISWAEGVDLRSGAKTFVPFDLVDCRFDLRSYSPFFRSSNGLASGNVWLEAVCAGICEVIERDAMSLWMRRTASERVDCLIDTDSVRHSDCRLLLNALAQRGIAVELWDATSDVGVACVVCRLHEAVGNRRSALGGFLGVGCHLDRAVALTRAVTEAAQGRLTFIAGSRDDLYCRDYAGREPIGLFELVRGEWERQRALRTFDSIPTKTHATFDDDLVALLDCLAFAGLDRAIAVDLTNETFGIPVVRIIVPGLEIYDEHNRHQPGRRALAFSRARQ